MEPTGSTEREQATADALEGASSPDAPSARATAPARPPRRGLVITLVVLGTILGSLSLIAVWANRQFLDTDGWTKTSTELLQSKPIRDQVSNFLVDSLYDNVDVQGELRSLLPAQAQGLAAPAAAGLRNLADQGANELLSRPRAQELWADANRAAHAALLKVLEGGGDVVSTEGGTVTLNLRNLLVQASQTLGVGQQLVGKIPPDAAQITVLKSNQLKTAQDAVTILSDAAIALLILTLACFAAAVAIAGRRRHAVRAVGFGFLVIGVIGLVARALIGNAVVDGLATTAAVQPAVQSAWDIGTSMLAEAAESCIAYGVIIVLAAWLAGPTGVAVGARRWLAPYLRDPRIAYGGVIVIVLLLVVWGPTPATRSPLLMLLLIALIVLGTEALRRQVAREHPDSGPDELSERWRARWERASEAVSRRRGKPAAPAADGAAQGTPSADRLAQLERLSELQAKGVLDDAETAREKERILSHG